MRAILAGMMIGVGGCVYLSCDVKWVGAILFAIGLFTIFSFRFDLYTGKVGYIPDNPLSTYLPYLVIVILGNFVGTLIVGLMMPLESAEVLANVKLDNAEPLQVLFKGVLCGLLMFIAADSYKNTKSFLATFLCVPVFILSGFEHSIADMFYISSAMMWNMDTFLFTLAILFGNLIGCCLIPAYRLFVNGEEKA